MAKIKATNCSNYHGTYDAHYIHGRGKKHCSAHWSDRRRLFAKSEASLHLKTPEIPEAGASPLSKEESQRLISETTAGISLTITPIACTSWGITIRISRIAIAKMGCYGSQYAHRPPYFTEDSAFFVKEGDFFYLSD